MENIIMETKRLRLRQMTLDDKENLLEIFADPIAMTYYPSTKDEKQTVEWIEWTFANYHNAGVGLWIVEDIETGAFLGQCGIVPQEIDTGKVEMEIGYLFARRAWGNGFATEAAAACKAYGFNQLQLTQIISLPAVDNLPSRRVAERIGMTLNRVIHKWGKDVCVYAVTK